MKRSRFTDEPIAYGAAASRWQHCGGGCVPADGDQRGDFLRLQKEIREPGQHGDPRAPAVARREREVDAPGGRFSLDKLFWRRSFGKNRRPTRTRRVGAGRFREQRLASVSAGVAAITVPRARGPTVASSRASSQTHESASGRSARGKPRHERWSINRMSGCIGW